MKTVHKYRLEGPKVVNTLRLREGFRVVRAEYLLTEKAVYIWVEEPLSVDSAVCTRRFNVALSGEPVPNDFTYQATALDPFGPEAYHVYEQPEERAKPAQGPTHQATLVAA